MGEMESLPPGFRFHPTDEELVVYYLVNKVKDRNFTGRAITEVDLNKCEPWHLPEKAKVGEKEWYFYSLRDRKYPTGLRTNRATESGYWKATGKDREIFSSTSSALVGMKKTLVFYKGRAPKGEKTNWVMHEYRLDGKLSYRQLSSSSKDEWVLTRVFQKSSSTSGFFGGRKGFSSGEDGNSLYYNALMQPPLMISEHETSRQHVPCFSTANSDLLLDSHGGGDGPDLVNGSMEYLQMVQDSKYPHVSSSFNTCVVGTGGGVWDGGMGVSSSWLFSNNMGGVGSGSSCQMVKYGVENINGGGFASGVQEMGKFGVGREGLKDATYGSSFGYV